MKIVDRLEFSAANFRKEIKMLSKNAKHLKKLDETRWQHFKHAMWVSLH